MNRRFFRKEQVGTIKRKVAVDFVRAYLMVALDAVFAAGIHRPTLPPVDFIIVSDIISELSDMNFFLTRNFSPDLIKVTPYLLNAQNPSELLDRKNCVVITNRKFRNILLSLGFGKENKIVPITIEINNDRRGSHGD